MSVVKRIAEAEALPRGYGAAWYELTRMEAVCFPIPLNVIAGLVRRWYHAMRAGAQPSVIDAAHFLGWTEGRQYNRDEMRRIVRAEVDAEDRAYVARLQEIAREVREVRAIVENEPIH